MEGMSITVYPKKYAHGFCFAVLCCGYTLTDFPISIRLTSLALWQSNDCPSASKATLMNMDKYFMWIHYMNDCITTTKQSTTKPCAYFLGYTVGSVPNHNKPPHSATRDHVLWIFVHFVYPPYTGWNLINPSMWLVHSHLLELPPCL